MLAQEAVELVIGAGATAGVLAGSGRRCRRPTARIELAELPDGGEAGLIAEGVDGVPPPDADGGAARAVTDGGRDCADGARSICYSGHCSQLLKACGPGPAGVDHTRGAIAFPAGTTRPD